MRDITALTGVHRSTIARWINKGEFPQKDAPHAHPSGWLRSTYDRWLLGAAQSSRREDASVGT
jgi:predicted DNA-binding transcriptional regulator AlpA